MTWRSIDNLDKMILYVDLFFSSVGQYIKNVSHISLHVNHLQLQSLHTDNHRHTPPVDTLGCSPVESCCLQHSVSPQTGWILKIFLIKYFSSVLQNISCISIWTYSPISPVSFHVRGLDMGTSEKCHNQKRIRFDYFVFYFWMKGFILTPHLTDWHESGYWLHSPLSPDLQICCVKYT